MTYEPVEINRYGGKCKQEKNKLKYHGGIIYLFIPVHEIHETFMVIVVMGTLGCIGRDLQIIGTKSVSLAIGIGEYPSLKQFVIGVVNARYNNGRAKCKLFVLGKEVVYVLIQDHATNRLEGQNILRPDLSYIKWVKIKSVLVFRIHCLDIKFPLRIVSSSN